MAASATMQALYDRMPVIPEEYWRVWLDEWAGEPTSFMQPVDDGLLQLWAVNSDRNKGPDLLNRIDDPYAPPGGDPA